MLELDNVSVTFNAGTNNEVKALKEVSLTVDDGDFVTVIGSNGAGKSTLFGVVAGAVAADSGEIVLDGRNITHWPEYRRSRAIGRVFQDPRLGTCPGLTIRENLSLAAIHGRRVGLRRDVKADQEQWFRDELEDEHLGLEERLDTEDNRGLSPHGVGFQPRASRRIHLRRRRQTHSRDRAARGRVMHVERVGRPAALPLAVDVVKQFLILCHISFLF